MGIVTAWRCPVDLASKAARSAQVLFLFFSLACRQEIPANQSQSAHGPKVFPRARIGYVPIAVALPLFIAADNGYFKDAGVDVDLVRIATSNDLATAGTLGRVDFMMPCALDVIFNVANTSGVRHRLFGLNVYSDQPPHVADYLLVASQSKIKQIAELRGKRIAGHPSSATKAVIRLIMEKYGLTQADYTFVPLQPAEWGPALSSGAIDALAALEPQASELLASGAVRAVVSGFYAKLLPDLPLSGWWVSAKVFDRKDSAEIVQPVVSAYSRAVAYIEAHPEEAKQHFKSYAPVSEAALPRMQLNKWLTPADLNVGSVQRMADIFAQAGVLTKPIRVDDFLLK